MFLFDVDDRTPDPDRNEQTDSWAILRGWRPVGGHQRLDKRCSFKDKCNCTATMQVDKMLAADGKSFVTRTTFFGRHSHPAPTKKRTSKELLDLAKVAFSARAAPSNVKQSIVAVANSKGISEKEIPTDNALRQIGFRQRVRSDSSAVGIVDSRAPMLSQYGANVDAA